MDSWFIYGRAILITTVFYTGFVVFKKFVGHRIGKAAPHLSYREILQGVLEAVGKTSHVFLFTVALGFGLQTLNVHPTFEKYYDRFELLIFFIQSIRWANTFIKHYFAHSFKEKFASDQSAMTSINVLALAARILVFMALILLFLDSFGVNITTVHLSQRSSI